MIGALVIASGVALIAVFGASGDGGSDDRDDEFGIDDEGSSKDRLQDVITAFSSNGQRSAFIAYITLQVIFLLIAGGCSCTTRPFHVSKNLSRGTSTSVHSPACACIAKATHWPRSAS